jgi:predicted DNA-binding WGR domain protein
MARKNRKKKKSTSRHRKGKSRKSKSKSRKGKSRKPTRSSGAARVFSFVYRGITDKRNISFKTWQIAISSKNWFATRWGRAFGHKQTQTKTFKNRAAMLKAATGLVKQKLRKGYRPC